MTMTSREERTFVCDRCGATRVMEGQRPHVPEGWSKIVLVTAKLLDRIDNHLCTDCTSRVKGALAKEGYDA